LPQVPGTQEVLIVDPQNYPDSFSVEFLNDLYNQNSAVDRNVFFNISSVMKGTDSVQNVSCRISYTGNRPEATQNIADVKNGQFKWNGVYKIDLATADCGNPSSQTTYAFNLVGATGNERVTVSYTAADGTPQNVPAYASPFAVAQTPTTFSFSGPTDVQSIKISFNYEGTHDDYKIALDLASFKKDGSVLTCLPGRIGNSALTGASLSTAQQGLFNWKGDYTIGISLYRAHCSVSLPVPPSPALTVSRWAAKSIAADVTAATYTYKFSCLHDNGFGTGLSETVTIPASGSKQYPLVTFTSNPCTDTFRVVVYKQTGGNFVDVTYSLRNTDGSIYTGRTNSFWDVPSNLDVTKMTPDAYVYYQYGPGYIDPQNATAEQLVQANTTTYLNRFGGLVWQNGSTHDAWRANYTFACTFGESTTIFTDPVLVEKADGWINPKIRVIGQESVQSLLCSFGTKVGSLVIKRSTDSTNNFQEITSSVKNFGNTAAFNAATESVFIDVNSLSGSGRGGGGSNDDNNNDTEGDSDSDN
jgi:hypothetical protein